VEGGVFGSVCKEGKGFDICGFFCKEKMK